MCLHDRPPVESPHLRQAGKCAPILLHAESVYKRTFPYEETFGAAADDTDSTSESASRVSG